MASSKTYRAPGLNLQQLAQDLENWFRPQGYETQTLNTPGGLTVQARQTKDFFQKGGVALNVALTQQGDTLQAEVGTGKWLLHAASSVAAVIVFWPLVALPAYAAFKQKQIIDSTWEFLDQYVASGGQVGAVPSPWTKPAATAPLPPAGEELVCPACGHPVKPGAKFCENCGAKLAVACPQCGEPLQPGAKFCSNCGAQVGEA